VVLEMSEESKIDSDYVNMGDGAARPGGVIRAPLGLDDPNLSQEEKDLRLAIALQQQENQSAMQALKKKEQQTARSDLFRTGRSGVNSRLANVRDKDHGMLSVPASYNTSADSGAYMVGKSEAYVPPASGDSDAILAAELHKVEATSIGAADTADKLHRVEEREASAQATRTARSGAQAFNKIGKK